MNPLISVVIPTYQHARSIDRCLRSVFAQTYQPIEVIVVDDGSTDDTKKVLEPYRDRIRYVYQENAGSNPARNRGWKESSGTFLLFCDADVEMKPDMLEKLTQALVQNSDASYAYSAFQFGWKTFHGVAFNADRLRMRNYIHTSALVRADAFPGFDEKIKRLQDWDVWLSMLQEGKTGVLVDEVLFHVHVDGTSRIGSSWLPSFLYRVPWKRLGFMPSKIRNYYQARSVLAKKHQLPYEA